MPQDEVIIHIHILTPHLSDSGGGGHIFQFFVHSQLILNFMCVKTVSNTKLGA